MFILIDENGALTLEQPDDFKSFSIVDHSVNQNHTALLQIAEAEADEENHFWIEAEAVVALSPQKDDSSWTKDFWSMLSAAEQYGYSNMELKKVKAHINTE